MKMRILITGGAGFIGSNAAYFFLKKGYSVTIFDNFIRLGTRQNAAWVKNQFPSLTIATGDIRNFKDLKKAVNNQDIILHLAGQVAVTSSVSDPRTDFEINALGTFNLLEAVRLNRQKPVIIFSSTNKVYGKMDDVEVVEKDNRYEYKNAKYGISEKMNLDFHSPYGCSKGAADQYVRDYSRIYDLPTVVFRQSCIYGPRQFGVEDQGWIAWFIIAASLGKKITVYGDGKQVRDILYVDDLIELYNLAISKINIVRGKIYNIGGGNENTLSVWSEFGLLLENLFQKKIQVHYSDWRPGDQKVYISDIRLIRKELGWIPKTHVKGGIEKLYNWVWDNRRLFKHFQ